jgi:hypothetical protein
MDEIDKVLNAAGERWRSLQPAPAVIDAAALARSDRKRVSRLSASLAAGAVGAAIVVAIAAIGIRMNVWHVGDLKVGTPPSEALASHQVISGCAVTRPEPAFVAPSPYPAEAPPLYESSWYGSDALWTMLRRDGEVWPPSAIGSGQKTFWWSVDWSGMRDDSKPQLSVVGTQLDGQGTFTAGPATNAGRADFGEAMLVGMEIPTAGCWQITASYGEATISYVVLVRAD